MVRFEHESEDGSQSWTIWKREDQNQIEREQSEAVQNEIDTIPIEVCFDIIFEALNVISLRILGFDEQQNPNPVRREQDISAPAEQQRDHDGFGLIAY